MGQSNAPIEEIVVSADFRNSSLNQITSSVTVLDSQQITAQNARHLEEMLINAPNVNMAGGSSRARFIQIRGIGERGQFTEPLNPSVGILVDGVDFSSAGTATTLYDVEQVEVLMGPQGTRYGSNALAGLINMESRAPTDNPGYGLQMEAGNFDTRSYAGYVSGPLGSDNLLYRISGQHLESDGYSDNLFLNRPTNQRQESTLRGRLRWQAGTDTTVDLNTLLVDVDNGYDAFSLDNLRDTLSDEPGFDRQRSRAFGLRVRSDAPSAFSLEALLNHADSDIAYGYDEDWVYAGFHPDGYDSTDHYYRDRDNLSAELRLLSNDSSRLFDGRTDWVLGIYSLQQSVDLQRVYTYLAEDFFSQYEIDRLALYAETNTRLSERFSMDVGLRAERFEGRYRDSSALAFRPDEDLFGGKLSLNFHTADDALVYLSASRGYKTGGFNTDGSLDADLREFDAEFLWNYELGYKGTFLDNQLSAQAALFYMDRNDVQISSSTLRMREGGSTEFIDYTGNAAGGANYGIELNATWHPNERLGIYAALGLLQTRYENFINSAGDDLDGRDQAHAPEYQFSLGTEILLMPDLILNISVQGRDGFYFSDSHSVRSSSYALWHSSLSYQFNDWRISLWGRNLGDRDYHVRGYYFGNDPRDGYTEKGYTQLGEPRHYGVRVNYDF